MKNLISKNINWKNIVWELIVVFIGLLSALYVDSLIEDRKDRKKEKVYLSEIKNNIENDIEKLDEVLLAMQDNLESIKKLNQSIYVGEVQKDSLIKYFGRLIFVKEFHPNHTALEVIKNKGDLDIIKNQELLYKLNELQKFNIKLDRSTNEVKDFYKDRIEPFMLNELDLKDYVWNDTITINADQLIRNSYFQNLIMLAFQKWATQHRMHQYYKEQLTETLQILE